MDPDIETPIKFSETEKQVLQTLAEPIRVSLYCTLGRLYPRVRECDVTFELKMDHKDRPIYACYYCDDLGLSTFEILLESGTPQYLLGSPAEIAHVIIAQVIKVFEPHLRGETSLDGGNATMTWILRNFE